jgi:predicted DNA-binding protein with PD1-like motif
MLRNASAWWVLSFSIVLAGCSGTQTRSEVVKATTPFDDGKPNSSAVPDGYAITTAFERIVVLRFKFDVDLLDGIERQVKELGIEDAVILGAIGSVRGYHVHSVSNRSFPSKNVFVKDPMAPADIVSMNGYVISRRVHAHIVLADPDRAFGGHLERETRVFTFAVVTLGVLREPVSLDRVDDKTYR